MKIAKAIAADVYLNDGEDFHTAGIDIFYAKDKPDETGFISPHGNAIECYGDGEDAARYLRDRVLLCMTMHDELVEALRSALDGTLMRDGLNRNDDGLVDLLRFGTTDADTKSTVLAVVKRIRAVLAKAEGR